MPSHRTRATALRGAPHRRCALDASISDIAILTAPARTRGGGQRRALLAGTMLAGVVLFTALAAAPARADGGAGGTRAPRGPASPATRAPPAMAAPAGGPGAGARGPGPTPAPA